jgi:hypothetical protein
MLDEFIQKIKAREPLSFSRWGDGEWKAVFDSPGANCDGHEYFPDMNEALRQVLISQPKYIMGMQNFAVRRMGDQIEQFLLDHDLNIDWKNADVFHHASIKGRFDSFIESLKESESRVFLVGPECLNGLKFIDHFIKVSDKNCWKDRAFVVKTLDYQLTGSDHAIVLFCASMASNVMIDDLYKHDGPKHTLLDMGSVFMPYVGIANRSYHKDVINRLK